MADLNELITRRARYLAEEERILLHGVQSQLTNGEGGSLNQRAQLSQIQATIKDLDQQIAVETARSNGTSRVRYGVPNW